MKFPSLHQIKMVILTVFLLFLIIGCFLYGAVAYKHNLFPMQLKTFQDYLGNTPNNAASSLERYDKMGRLTNYPNKVEVNCPRQTPNTAVILTLGQSNSCNYGGQRFFSEYGDRVLNFFDGKCYISSSPLLGGFGIAGESFTLLGNKLIESNYFDRVIIIPGAVGGRASYFKKNGEANKMMQETISSASRSYKITHIIYHQGEGDYAENTSKDDYLSSLNSLVDSIRAVNVNAKIYISTATKCGLPWKPKNSIAEAQEKILNDRKGIVKGVNTDKLILDVDRYDGCHFGYSGQQKFADALRDLLVRD